MVPIPRGGRFTVRSRSVDDSALESDHLKVRQTDLYPFPSSFPLALTRDGGGWYSERGFGYNPLSFLRPSWP